MKIHHVGYLVKKQDKALKAFYGLGFSMKKESVYDEYRKADICLIEKDGYVVELVSPADKESVVYDLLKRYGNSAYHICYEAEDFEKEYEALLSLKYVPCGEIHEAIALDNKKVCHLIHPYMGMVEIVEK